MRGKKKSLDDFFAKNANKYNVKSDCDLSLCSATTRKHQPFPKTLCTWKRNPNAFQLVQHPSVVSLSSLSEKKQSRQDILLLSVKEESTSLVSETTTSSLGGVTLGIAKLLYDQEDSKGGSEERTGVELSVCDDTVFKGSSITVHDDNNQSIEVSMSGLSIDDESAISSLGKKGARRVKEARLAEQKVRNEENKLAAQRRFLDMEHSEFQSILKEFRKDAQRAEERLREEEARLTERRRLLKEAYLKEQARLLEEEEKLILDRRKTADATRRILEEAYNSDLDISIEEQVTRSLSTALTLGVLSESTWENDDDESEVEVDNCENISLGQHHWRELNASKFKVRGRNYLDDKKKVPSQPNLFRLITVDLVEVSEPIMTGFCSRPTERVQKWLQQEKYNSKESLMPSFVFCVNMILPGPPYYHLVMYFGIDGLEELGLISGSKKQSYTPSLKKFLFGNSDEFRNKTLKFLPNVKEGSFLLKTAVGTKPFILGNYLNQKFIRGERFLEVVADVGSSTTFQKLLKLSSNYKSKIVGSMAFVLEGTDRDSLPENIMCSVELNNQDFDGNIRFVDNEKC